MKDPSPVPSSGHAEMPLRDIPGCQVLPGLQDTHRNGTAAAVAGSPWVQAAGHWAELTIWALCSSHQPCHQGHPAHQGPHGLPAKYQEAFGD